MRSDFFISDGSDSPLFQQNLSWFLGHPSVWLTILLWALLLIAAFKIAKRLFRLQTRLWFGLFIGACGVLISCYIWLLARAYKLFVEGVSGFELVALSYANSVIVILSFLSGSWLVFDWLRTKRTQ